jgi:hypothetical protein
VAADLYLVPDTGARGRVAHLRRELAHHPVHRWAASRADRSTLLAHVAFSHWAGAVLASTLGVPGPAGQFDDTCRALRRRGAAGCISAFAAAVVDGIDPVAALADADGPGAAGPLVELVARLAARGTPQARAGALVLGLPGSVCVQAANHPDDLTELTDSGDLGSRPEAEDAATAVLVAQLTLLDGALQEIRHRHMAAHPAMWRRQVQTPPRLRLLPAS